MGQQLWTREEIGFDQSVISQAEADQLAAARMDEISGAFIEAQGVAFRRPDIQTGKFVQLDGLGRRLSGSYLVIKAQHVFTAEGLRTYFEACAVPDRNDQRTTWQPRPGQSLAWCRSSRCHQHG